MAEDACCRIIRAALDAHLHGAGQRRRHAGSAHAVVAMSAPESGIGDQLSSFLGALTIAVGSRRRLEILSDGRGTTSYIAAGFDLAFDAGFTGRHEWLREAERWFSNEYAAYLGNATRPLRRLPRYGRKRWGLTVTTGESALAARLIVPSPSGHYPPMHSTVFDRAHEFVLGGNVGTVVFREYFKQQLLAHGVPYNDGAVGCALRHLLRPGAAVRELINRLRPAAMTSSAGARGAMSGGSLVVGVHIRAAAHLINRASRNEASRYEERAKWSHASKAGAASSGAFAADRVFAGCGTRETAAKLKGSVPHSVAARGRVASPYTVANYSEYWLAALAATRHWREGAPAATAVSSARWLVVSDVATLKHEAAATWPDLVAVTTLVPSQPGACGVIPMASSELGVGPTESAHREAVLHTVAELLLLSEVDMLVLGRSRFPMAALLLSKRCRAAYHLYLDRACRRARKPYASEMAHFAPAQLIQNEHSRFFDETGNQPAGHSRRVLRCFGTGGAYSARSLQDAQGNLLRDGMLSNF